MKLLLVVDLQKEFINEQVMDSVDKIKTLVDSSEYDDICFTKYINSENSPVYTKTGWHGCMTEKSQAICIDTYNYSVFSKSSYSACTKEFLDYLNMKNITEVYLCGIDIECCLLATAFSLFDLGYNVFVLKNYSFCRHGEQRKLLALKIFERNFGISSIK